MTTTNPRTRCSWRVHTAGVALAICVQIVFAGHAAGQTTPPVLRPGDLKKLSLDELQAIEVTSVSKRPERISTAASSIQVITADDIRRAGATSLPEALRLASNLQVAQVDSHGWAITARGFNNTIANKLLVLVDGRTVYTPLDAGVFWDVQDTLLEDVERIEVISGPGATLWGANAVNGVINIITKSAADTQGLFVTGGGGSELQGLGGIRYGATIGADVKVRGYAKYFGRDNTSFPTGARVGDDWRTGQGGFRVDWSASGVDRFTIQGDVYNGRIAQPAAGHAELGGGNVIARWSHARPDKSDFSLQLYYDRTHRNIPGTFTEDVDTYDADFQHHVRVGKQHDFVWGLGYRVDRDDVGTTGALLFLPAKVSQQWFSGFVQDEVPLANDRVRLTFGTKIERNDYTGVEVEPGGRVAWMASPRQMLWGAIARAVRTPSRIDRDFFVPVAAGSSSYLLAGGPGFTSENVMAYEVGYRTEPHDRVYLTVATFYNDYGRIRSIEQLTPPAPTPLVFGNGQAGHAYGAELTGEYRPAEWWRLRSGYTTIRVDIRPEPGSTDRTFGSGESHDPRHQWFLRQSLDLPLRVQFDLGFRYVGEIANQQLAGYAELDARAGWLATKTMECSIVGQNLLHPHHAEFGALTSRKEVDRGVYGKVAWRF